MVSRRAPLMLIGATAMARQFAPRGKRDNRAIVRVSSFYANLQIVTAGAHGSDPKQRIPVLSRTMMQTVDMSAVGKERVLHRTPCHAGTSIAHSHCSEMKFIYSQGLA